jgi:hypothetical protein
MVERLPGRWPGWTRLVVLVAVWIAIYVGTVHRLWAVVCLVGVVATLWLLWSERATTPRRTILQAALRTAFWAIASLLAFVVLVIALIVAATIGAGFGWWGSPWDGR